MKNLKLNELTLDNLDVWPLAIKAGVIIACCVLLCGLAYWFDIRTQLSQLNKAEQQEQTLRTDFQVKALEAGNLPAYRQQLQTLQKTWAGMIQQLPGSTEIPSLLEDISRIGINNGLQFQLFKPLPEQNQSFFIELPIQISVMGNYHQLGSFVAQLAGLNRIVTLEDFEIAPYKNAAAANSRSQATDNERLVMHVMAKTYRDPGAPKTPTILALPAIKNYAIPKYEAANFRSPFQAGPGAVPDLKRPKEPLENFPLGSLHLVGIITRGDQAWGLITAPDGKLYQVTVGDHLGQNQGRVIAVHNSYLDIVESIAEGNSWREHPIKLVLWSHVPESPLKSAKAK